MFPYHQSDSCIKMGRRSQAVTGPCHHERWNMVRATHVAVSALLSFIVLYVHRNHQGLSGTGEWRLGKREREIVYLSLQCHPPEWLLHGQRAGDERHFIVSLIVRDTVTRWCPQTTTIMKRTESRGLSAYQPNALPLGHTGSHVIWMLKSIYALHNYQYLRKHDV